MTIISPRRNFCFLHFHKCGGTSIELAYENVALITDIIIGSTKIGEIVNPYYTSKFFVSKHASASEVAASMGESWEKMEKFTLVRNHFRVFESFYGWIERIVLYGARTSKRTVSFVREAILSESGIYHFETWGSAKSYSRSNNFEEFLVDVFKNKSLPRQTYLERMDIDRNRGKLHVFDIKDIDKFWISLEETIGVGLPRKHENKSGQKPEFKWSIQARDEVIKLFYDDFEYFNFSKDPYS